MLLDHFHKKPRFRFPAKMTAGSRRWNHALKKVKGGGGEFREGRNLTPYPRQLTTQPWLHNTTRKGISFKNKSKEKKGGRGSPAMVSIGWLYSFSERSYQSLNGLYVYKLPRPPLPAQKLKFSRPSPFCPKEAKTQDGGRRECVDRENCQKRQQF